MKSILNLKKYLKSMKRVYDPDEKAYFKQEFLEELRKRKENPGKTYTLEEAKKHLGVK